MPTLSQDRLAKLLRDTEGLIEVANHERRQHNAVVSALLELLGGQAFLPKHVLDSVEGFQSSPGEHAGDIVLTSLGRHAH